MKSIPSQSTPLHAIRALPWLLLCGVLVGALIILWPRQKINPILPEFPREALALRDGRLFRKGESVPFTGFLVERLRGKVLVSRSEISHGLLNGISQGWHTNGVLQVREYFTNGVSHGLRQKWRPDGTKISEVLIVNGKLDGLFRRWHENGQLAEQIPMKEGDADGTGYSFYPSGFLKGEATLKNGKLLAQHSWQESEAKKVETDAGAMPVR